MRHLRVLASVGFVALTTPAFAQSSGTLTLDGAAMPVKAAVAVLDSDGTGIRIYVLPFVPTAAQTADLQKQNTLFLIDKKSAYGSFWLNWFGAADTGKMDKVSVSLTGHDFGKSNQTWSRMFMSGFKGTLTGELKPGATIAFTAAGTAAEKNDSVAWDFKAQAKVVPEVE